MLAQSGIVQGFRSVANCRLMIGGIGSARGRKTFKQKVARIHPKRTPSGIAIDNFDFYYGPVFGKEWHSIRMALLNPNKYFAVLNQFARTFAMSESFLEEDGAFNIVKFVEENNAESCSVQQSLDRPETGIKFSEHDESDKDEPSVFFDSRDESGLSQFVPSGRTATMAERTMGIVSGERSRGKTNKNITITGFERQYVHLECQEHKITYPNDLKVYTFPRGSLNDYPVPEKDSKNVPNWWLLDGGSLMPVLAMNIAKGDNVLDMCAAPGGKSLLMMQTNLIGRLTCNDNKQSRLGQLHRALSTYIPVDSEVADRVILKRKDASSLESWDEISVYDKVLVDAPCTSDRLSVNRDDGNLYSTSMTNERLNLPQIQTRMLINGLRSVNVGGDVVYSTCALSPAQNEAVVENAVAILQEHFNIKAVELELSQLQKDFGDLFRFSNTPVRGALIVPFLPFNCGPMYICKLRRLQ